jgi:hypothetical protein
MARTLDELLAKVINISDNSERLKKKDEMARTLDELLAKVINIKAILRLSQGPLKALLRPLKALLKEG